MTHFARAHCALFAIAFGASASVVLATSASACSASSPGGDVPPVADAQWDDVAAADGTPPSFTPDGVAPPADAAVEIPQVRFEFAPAWSGVRSVTVAGGFGQTTDWSATGAGLLDLTPAADGTFAGSAALPPGEYLYVFRVTGDDDASNPAGTRYFAIDPGNPAVDPCPAASPTFRAGVENPCSKLTVPQSSTPLRHHVTGAVAVDGLPASGYVVVLERHEGGEHHYFVNRTTTGADGRYDFSVADGRYRVQVWHPSLLKQTDAARDPLQYDAQRRALSSSFAVSGDVDIPSVELSLHGYARFAPTGDAGSLPTRFSWPADAGSARLALYGSGPNIGDPLFLSAPTKTGYARFDGRFNTGHAGDGGVRPGVRYFWGTESDEARDGGVAWTHQSMVLPIRWP